MNADMIVWPGGEHPFRLALAQLEGLQQKTDCGPEWLAMKLRSGQWTATEAFETLRWGLIGAVLAARSARNTFEFYKFASWRFVRCRMTVREPRFGEMLRRIA